jgi:deaminated glutathione amidase
MVPFAIAGIQMRVSAEVSNVAQMASRLAVVMNRFPWVQMVLFSELCAHGPLPRFAQPLPGPSELGFCELARRHDIWLIPGSMFEAAHNKIFNTASVINPRGEVVGRYRKMFPFEPYEANVEAGREFLVFDVPSVGRFGVSICYDMWFPETSRTLAAMGAEAILHPSLTDTIDRDVELSIVRATAAMNQCYVFDINGVGQGGIGRSIIVDPSGHVVHAAGSDEEVMPVEIDFDRVRRERAVGLLGLGQTLKSFRDRRADFPVYRSHDFDAAYLDSLGPLTIPARRSSRPADGPAAGAAAVPSPAAGGTKRA